MKPRRALFAGIAVLAACIQGPTDVHTESLAEELSRKMVWEQLTGRVAFSAKCGRYQICMYVADATSRSVREVSSPGEWVDGINSIAWAPDGMRVYYGVSHGGTSFESSVWSSSINGGPVTYVLPRGDRVSLPSVSSTGEVAFIRLSYPNPDRLCIVNQQCLPGRRYGKTRAAWAPDGQALVFTIVDDQGRSALAIAQPAMASTTIPIVPVGAPAIVSATGPAFSPGGARIAFVAGILGNSVTHEIWTMKTDGSDARRVIGAGQFSDPAWSRDGTAILYVGQRGSETGIMRINIDGTNASTVLKDDRVGQLAWWP